MYSPTSGVTVLDRSTGGGNTQVYAAIHQQRHGRRKLQASKHGRKQCWV